MRSKKQSSTHGQSWATARKVTVAKQISEQLNRMLKAKFGQGELLQHNLEKGLGNEQALRDLLSDFLPRRYGVAKGKVANPEGDMSRQLDVIIYDAVNCPTLFIDEHENQILPIEGVFGVIEAKTSLTASTLADAFQNLGSVYGLAPRVNRSRRGLVTACPPYLHVFAFRDVRPLQTVARQFATLSRKNPVAVSCYSYSEKSPAFSECTGDRHLVCSVDILGKGSVHHTLDGAVDAFDYGEYTLGLFLVNLLADYTNVQLQAIETRDYLNWIQVTSWAKPDSSLRRRQVVYNSVRKALASVHGDAFASGSWPRDGTNFEFRFEAVIGGENRKYSIVIPHSLSPKEIERSATSQIRDTDGAIGKLKKVAEPETPL